MPSEMIKAMRETAKPAKSESGFGRDTYMSMFDMELARILSERGLGLQEVLVNGMSRHSQQTATPEASTAGKQKNSSSGTEISGAAAAPAAGAKTVQPEQGARGDLHAPVRGVISSRFGMRKHPIYGNRRFHRGLDIAAPAGTEIRPIDKGKVIFSGEKPGYGNTVIIDHGNGMISKYSHNKQNLVKVGDEVDQNTIIAEVGSHGVSTGSHLHFEVKKDGRSINPLTVLAMK